MESMEESNGLESRDEMSNEWNGVRTKRDERNDGHEWMECNEWNHEYRVNTNGVRERLNNRVRESSE